MKTLSWNIAVIGALTAAVAVTVPVLAASGHISHHPACDNGGPDTARCHARVVDNGAGKPVVNAVTPVGYGPAQFRGAYGLSGTVAGNPIVAIVDAYDNPNALADLNAYSAAFGIPSLPACSGPINSSAVPCFQKVDQSGGTAYPRKEAGWALESSLDIQAVHAVCENCRILLVEAKTNSYANLIAAVDRARILGAKIISNSYGSSEFSGQTGSTYDGHFNYPGIAFTFSSGDAGYGVEYPAASRYVTAVGGTTLNMNGATYVSESAWSGAGSGCSQYSAKPSWQTDTGCSRRTVADVSADADPATGAAVYDSTGYQGRTGWFQVGGTSLAAPLIAGTYAYGTPLPVSSYAASLPYAGTAYLHDVTSGSNGSCNLGYLCTAITGYDGPTGLGSPNGSGAF
jgi:subtilase family serine protease